MLRFPVLTLLAWLLLSGRLLLGALPAWAQAAPAAPHGYDFMMVIATQTSAAKNSLLQFIPTFRGKTEIQLEPVSGLASYYSQDSFKRNTELINQQLGLATAQGWELVQVLPSSSLVATSYLFRKPRP